MLFGKYLPQHNMVPSAALANVFIDCVMHYLHACMHSVMVTSHFQFVTHDDGRTAGQVYHKHFTTINSLFDDARSISDTYTNERLTL